MKIISVRKNPEYREKAISYIQQKWSLIDPVIYENSITHSISSQSALPQWYLLESDSKIIGCAGLITNDFISRMDLYPWLCALYIDEYYRGNNYASLLINQAINDSRNAGFRNLYLCTDLMEYYERFGFQYIGQGYHPWEEESKIYTISTKQKVNKNYVIRKEEKKDYSEVYSLIKKAFETAAVKDGDEQDYAVGLRESEKYIPELALVAEKDGELIGHIMLTKFNVLQTDNTVLKALLVAPLSVKLEYRKIGVGSQLMEEGFRIAKKMGYTSVFLCGDPLYYNRFGFIASSDYGIRNLNNIPEKNSLTHELFPCALDDIEGTIDFYS